MALRLITGPANSAKAGRVMTAYRTALDREPLLVVPRFEDVLHYRRELAREGVVFGGRVMGFARLWREIARRTGFAPPRLGALARERVLRAAVAHADVGALAPSSSAPGFVAAAGRFIAELEAALVEPDELGAALEEWAAASGERRALARDLAALHRSYWTLLHRVGRVDREGFAREALQRLRAAPGAWGRAPVFLYGFDDLTGLELAAIEALAAQTEVTVSLTWEDGRQAFASRSRTVEALRRLASGEERLPARPAHYAQGSQPALHHLERRLFAATGERPDPGSAVALLEAGGERAEIELVAAEVLDHLRSGLPPAEIAVVLASPGASASLVEQVFRAYGIPVAVERPLALAHTALGTGLLGLLRCASPAGGAGDLVAYLRASRPAAEAPEIDGFEAAVRRAGERTAAGARRRWERSHPRLAELDALEGALAGSGIEPRCAAVGELAETLLVAGGRGGAPRLDDAETAAYRGVVATLEELAATACLPGLPGADPREELLDALAGLELRVGRPAAGDTVVVSDALAVRARRFGVVVIAGLQEGAFPRPSRPDPFLPEEARRVLARSRPSLHRPQDRLDDERFLFYAVASRPRRRLVLSYRTSDEEGRPLVASPFLAEVRALFDERLHRGRRRRPLGEVTWPVVDAPTPAELERSLRAAGPPEAPQPIAPVSAPAALAELRARPPVSPGALEAYARCPVAWLVERVLRARGIEPEPQPLTRGAFAHAVLERTLTGLRERRGSARVTATTLALAQQLLDAAVADLCAAEEFVLAPTAGESRAVARRVQLQLRRFLRHEARGPSDFEPAHLELDFGFDGEDSLPPLELGAGGLAVRGRIDRVDVDEASGRAIVRDYKAGESVSEHAQANWRQSGRLQVALYMLAVERGLGYDVAGGVYQSLQGSDLRARGLLLDVPDVRQLTETTLREADLCDPETFQAALRQAEEAAVELAEGIRAGRLEPCPSTCGYRGGGCAYPGICRTELA